METSFNYEDFGFPDRRTFELALTCGPIVRFEIRKALADVKHAKRRLELCENMLASEIEVACQETAMTKFIAGYAEMHGYRVVVAETKLAFLRAHLTENV